MKQILLLLIAICISIPVLAQEKEKEELTKAPFNPKTKRRVPSPKSKKIIYREFGFNTVSILQSIPIVPIGRTGFPIHAFFYKRKKEGKNKLFRFHAAGNIRGGEDNGSTFELKFGTENPRTLTKVWEYYYGYDFLLFTEEGNSAGIGFGPIFGMKYKLSDFITFGTEGSGYFTISGGNNTNVGINLRPVNGIFMSFKLYK